MLLLLALWSLALFTRSAPFTPDEPREFGIAWNMLHQADKSMPLLAGEPFLEKPPLEYWAAAGSMAVFGPTLWAARLPNLIWAAITVLCMIAWVRNAAPFASSNRVWQLTALCCGSMLLLFRVQMWLATDALLVAATAVSLLGAWRGVQATSSRERVSWYLLMHLGLCGAFFAKNVFGWLVPILALVLIVAWEKRWRELLRWELHAGIALVLLPIGYWIWKVSQHTDGPRLLRILLVDNTLGRFLPIETTEHYEHAHLNHPGKYLLELPVYLLPWTFAAVAALRWAFKRAFSKGTSLTSAARFAIAAVAPGLVFLSIANTARDVYFAPELLGFVMLLGLWFVVVSDESYVLDGVDRFCLRATSITTVTLGVLMGALAIGVPVFQQQWTVSIDAALVALVAAGLLFFAVRRLSVSAPALRPVVRGCGAYIVGQLIVCSIFLPSLNASQDLRPVVQSVVQDFGGRTIGIYRGDETIRAYFDFDSNVEIKNLQTLDEAEAWVRQDVRRVLVVETYTDHVTPAARARLRRLNEHWNNFARRDVNKEAKALHERGLIELWHYEVEGGRAYGVLGLAASIESKREDVGPQLVGRLPVTRSKT